MELRICFEVSATVNGEPDTFGMQVSLGETDYVIPYETLTELIDIGGLISMAGLDHLGVTKEDVRFITPEQYDRMYSEKEDKT